VHRNGVKTAGDDLSVCVHVQSEPNKKFELMLTRRAKAYSSSSSQTVCLSPAISSQFVLRVCAAAEDRKNQYYFQSSGSFKVIDVDTTEKLVTSACCGRTCPCLSATVSQKTGQQRQNNDFYSLTGVPLFDALVRRFS